MNTKWMNLAVGLGMAVGLAGCASKQALVPDVQQQVDADGKKTITVAAEKVQCSRPQCPELGASWHSAKPGQAVLSIRLPYQQSAVTGADFHFGAQTVLRVRSRAQSQPQSPTAPTTAFDVPLQTMERIATAPVSWMRVYTADGGSVDEHISTGEEGSPAFSAMHYFMNSVLAAGGQGAGGAMNQGGLMDRLGLSDKKR